MIYNICDIKKSIRIAIDQNNSSTQLIVTDDIDTLTLDEIIENKIEDAVRIVEMSAPIYMLNSGNNFADAIYWEDGYWGWTILPDDFMRLIVFKMNDWTRAVYSAIPENNPQYELQSSRWQGLRGTPQKPVCAIVVRAEGKVLEFYSCKTENANVKQAVYLPIPKLKDGGIEICERCYRAIVYYAAGLVQQEFGIDATSFFEISKSLII
ncbi:hypothetical protein OCV73_02525 [Barnesiella propionica]|uniref:hypothetical protein n=1 Tax=Barnesiella propionica TaxID=2981781 RepID=UPI0011CC982A|nr:hypothetical protein [Barnesiella propionica]MCU6767833.1 hypothetical protein [Barnesiella propionica]